MLSTGPHSVRVRRSQAYTVAVRPTEPASFEPFGFHATSSAHAPLGSMMVSADNREQGDPDDKRFCGTGALTMEQKENYAMLMRIATLSSMQANYTSSTMGFRCVAGSEPMP